MLVLHTPPEYMSARTDSVLDLLQYFASYASHYMLDSPDYQRALASIPFTNQADDHDVRSSKQTRMLCVECAINAHGRLLFQDFSRVWGQLFCVAFACSHCTTTGQAHASIASVLHECTCIPAACFVELQGCTLAWPSNVLPVFCCAFCRHSTVSDIVN
jgi:hypothetical protein